MSFALKARMAQFELHDLVLVNRPAEAVDPRIVVPGFPDDTAHLATVHWVVQPEIGLPAAPFQLELCPHPLSADGHGWTTREDVQLSGKLRDFSFQRILSDLRASDALCVTVATQAEGDVEIFAYDASGAEIPETRQSGNAPLGTAFLGPGITGLRATGDTRLRNLTVFALDGTAELEFVPMATVAPALNVGNYAPQTFLGKRYSVDDALYVRLAMDALARANTAPPSSKVLEDQIHREDPKVVAARAIASQPMREIEQDFPAYLADPRKSFDVRIPPNATASVCPSAMLQMLALSDPVTATALGAAATIPVPKPFRYITSVQEIYEAVEHDKRLPFPVVRLHAYHRDAAGKPIQNSGLAGLVLSAAVPGLSIRSTEIQPPPHLDEPASCCLNIALRQPVLGLSYFVGLEPNLEAFPRDRDCRIMHCLSSNQPEDRTLDGWPSIRNGGVKLPLEARETHQLALYVRDLFGRWPVRSEASYVLDPWPVQKPGCGPIEQTYGEDGTVTIGAILSWDWSTRTPFEIRIGLKVSAPGAGIAVNPQDGVNLLDASFPVAIRFATDGTPQVPANAPSGWSIAALPSTYAQTANSSDIRTYKLRIALGTAAAVFSEDYQREVVIAADAWEVVSGQTPGRRSDAASASAVLHDPRPPVLTVEPWRLEWSSRVDGANIARAYVDPTPLVGMPVAGFFVWRAHEAAIVEVAVAATTAKADEAERIVAELRSERDMAIRLAMIQGLCEPHLHKPKFKTEFANRFEVDDEHAKAGPCEVRISGARTGLEFVMVTAISKANVASDKSALAGIRAIAVPAERGRKAPMLRISRPESTTAFARSGLCIVSIGATSEFEADETRIFWDDEPTALTGEELLHQLRPVSELSLAQAGAYIPGIGSLLNRNGSGFWRHFVVKPPESWQTQSFSVDIVRASAHSPADQVATPRSDVQRLTSWPILGPTLLVVKQSTAAGARSWTIDTQNVLVNTPANMHECLIQLQLILDGGSIISSDTIGFAAFQNSGLQVSDGLCQVFARKGTTLGQIVIETPNPIAEKSIRIAASDPAGRIDAVTLS